MCFISFGYVTLVLHLARGSGSIMGSLFKVIFARGINPYMRSLFSKCTSRVVVFSMWAAFQSASRVW
jgi:hypothetical protein